MKTLAVISRKGGAGKTTVAVSLALAAQQAGLKVVLADIDPLHSASEVLRDRAEAATLLVTTSAAKLFVLHDACRRAGCDLLVIDTPSAPEADVALAANLADLCLAVARPAALDIAAVKQSVGLIRRLGCAGLVVLNQCPPSRLGEEPLPVSRAMEALQFSALATAQAKLRNRAAYQHAFADHCGVTEWDPASGAATDVLRLMAEISDHLLLPQPAEHLPMASPDTVLRPEHRSGRRAAREPRLLATA